MAQRIFKVESHYVVEVDEYVNAIESEEVERIRVWDIYIASDGKEHYKGYAIDNTGEYKVPWVDLDDVDLLQEMIEHCQMIALNI